MELYSPRTIEYIKARYGFSLSKSLGQNFITDVNVLRDIVEGAEVDAEDLVIEIGPGIGSLTAEAAKAAAAVVAVEIDSRLIPILEETLADFDNVEVINRDVLKTDLNEIIERKRSEGAFSGKVRIMGNLPYYITTPIIMKLLEAEVNADSITVMMQKEVADRINSGPGTKSYGAISVAVQYYCTVSKVATVPAAVFVPRPKVDSAVLNLKLREEKPAELIDRDLFFACVKAGFGQRRKTLLNSLTGVRGLEKKDIEHILITTETDPRRRAETLTIGEFAEIANCIAKYTEDRESINE